MKYDEAKCHVFAKGKIPDGLYGDTTDVEFAFDSFGHDEHSRLLLVICSHGFFRYHMQGFDNVEQAYHDLVHTRGTIATEVKPVDDMEYVETDFALYELSYVIQQSKATLIFTNKIIDDPNAYGGKIINEQCSKIPHIRLHWYDGDGWYVDEYPDGESAMGQTCISHGPFKTKLEAHTYIKNRTQRLEEMK